jgi:hypothetical protein
MLEAATDSATLTREELYDLVWSEPMWTLAQRFGLSDVGLAKTCRRFRIPVPGRGYWQQKQAGQAVRPPRLPTLPTSLAAKLDIITMRSPNQRRAVRQASVEGVEDVDLDTPPIVVAEVLSDPHPLVAHTVKALRRVKPTKEGLLPRTSAADSLDVRVTLDTADRAMRILDALLKAMDDRGFTISVVVNGNQAVTRAHVLDEVVPFHLEERMDQTPIEAPTPRRPGEWAPRPATRLVSTGALAFCIDAEWPLVEGDVRKSWRDGKQQRVEQCLGKIIAGFVDAARALKADRLAREERDRRWKEAERQRKRTAWEGRQEKRRGEALQEELDRWRLREELRAYVAMRRAGGPAPGTDTGRWEAWLDWIAKYADRIDARLAATAGPDPELFDENAYYY